MLIYYLIIILLALILTALLIMLGRAILFTLPMLHGPVFVPSSDNKLQTMLKLAQPKKTDKIIDLGSGDGKILISLARKGFKATGVEINPYLVFSSKRRVKNLGLNKLITIKKQNFWDINFKNYNLIFLYGTSYIMKRLEKKLQKELKPGSRVISNYFQFPTWQAKKQENQVRVYIK